uniref:NnrS family protein n=1 Tax=Parerythrobacter lutipelagi TaxID=1964208 RepID=UPI0010F95854|nr:NnrS family protein [Parerythrobacter lutipelagi]
MMSPSILLAAPHRLPFLGGAIGIGGLASWWLIQVLGLYGDGPLPPQTELPASLLHGPAMIYLGLAPFIFGFLLTVFPRWMSLPDLSAKQVGPAACALFAGVVTAQLGLWTGSDRLVLAGFGLAGAGWVLASIMLAIVLYRNRAQSGPRCTHGWSAMAGILFGLAGILCAVAFIALRDPAWLPIANRIGISGFLLPVFLTVAHRMVPFFAGNVVKDYISWRPDWLLALLWALLLARLVGEVLNLGHMQTGANAGLAVTTAVMCWRWWPKASAPGLLNVLIWGFAWAPVGFAFAAVDAAFGLFGRGPDHALMIGFCCSLLVAMVTRVTQGHSGRPLVMPMVSWVAFYGIQIAAISRAAAALQSESGSWLMLGAAAFAVSLLPWVIRNGAIYLSPRIDGKQG